MHNPTTLNRQGFDIGTQYRSIFFYHNKKQKNSILRFIDKLRKSGKYKDKIVTEVKPASEFYKAEEYNKKSDEIAYDPRIDTSDFIDVIDNKYFTLTPKSKYVYEAETEDGLERIEVYVTNEKKEVM